MKIHKFLTEQGLVRDFAKKVLSNEALIPICIDSDNNFYFHNFYINFNQPHIAKVYLGFDENLQVLKFTNEITQEKIKKKFLYKADTNLKGLLITIKILSLSQTIKYLDLVLVTLEKKYE